MLPLLSLLLVLLILGLLIRAAVVALVLTGVSEKVAEFQVLSAFSGVGFTTAESARVLDHPVRRSVIGWVIVIGNLGLFAALVSGFFSVVAVQEPGTQTYRAAVLGVGIAVLGTLFVVKRLRRLLEAPVRALMIQTGTFPTDAASELLDIGPDFRVFRITVDAGSWVVNRTLRELRLGDHRCTVLAIQRASDAPPIYPTPETTICLDDVLFVYASTKVVTLLEANEPPSVVPRDEGTTAS